MMNCIRLTFELPENIFKVQEQTRGIKYLRHLKKSRPCEPAFPIDTVLWPFAAFILHQSAVSGIRPELVNSFFAVL